MTNVAIPFDENIHSKENLEKRNYMYYYIYEIINKINGKTYIGQHKTKNINDNYFGSGTAITAAIKKYGKENFKKIILENGTKENINDLEIKWINKKKKNGKAEYNIAGGGSACSNPFEFKTEKEKQTIYKKSAISRKGLISGKLGKKYSNFSRGEYNKKFQPCKNSKRIKCIETNDLFNSIRECCAILHISHTDVSNFIKGKRKAPVGGYTFEEIKEHAPYVIIMETEQTFETIKDCAAFLKCDKSRLIDNLKRRSNQCSGYHMCYYNEYNKNNNPYFGLERYAIKKKRKSGGSGKKIICIENGKIYNSIAECSRELKIAPSGISNVCLGKRKTAGKLHFKYV